MNVDCPESVMPRNCRAATKSAATNGWKWRCHLAAGFNADSSDLVWSVVLKCQCDGVLLVGTWEGPAKDQLGWHSGWSTPPLRPLGWGEFHHALKGTEPTPTAKMEADLQLEANQHLAAIAMFKPIAWPIGVVRRGTKDRNCASKVVVGAPGVPFLPCAGFAEDGKLCNSCTDGLLAKESK